MTTAFTVELTSRRGRPVIGLGGECDLVSVPSIRAAVDEAVALGTTNLAINLDEVRYLDSTALGALIGAQRRLATVGGRVTLICSAGRVLRLLRLLEMDRVIDLKTSEQWEREEDTLTQVG